MRDRNNNLSHMTITKLKTNVGSQTVKVITFVITHSTIRETLSSNISKRKGDKPSENGSLNVQK